MCGTLIGLLAFQGIFFQTAAVELKERRLISQGKQRVFEGAIASPKWIGYRVIGFHDDDTIDLDDKNCNENTRGLDDNSRHIFLLVLIKSSAIDLRRGFRFAP